MYICASVGFCLLVPLSTSLLSHLQHVCLIFLYMSDVYNYTYIATIMVQWKTTPFETVYSFSSAPCSTELRVYDSGNTDPN